MGRQLEEFELGDMARDYILEVEPPFCAGVMIREKKSGKRYRVTRRAGRLGVQRFDEDSWGSFEPLDSQ